MSKDGIVQKSNKISTSHANLHVDYTQNDLDQFWDHSPEQYMLSEHLYDEATYNLFQYEGTELIFTSNTLPSSLDSDYNGSTLIQPPCDPSKSRNRIVAFSSTSHIPDNEDLTSEDSTDEVFPIEHHKPLTRSALKRQNAFRKKRPAPIQHSTVMLHCPSRPCPSSPGAVNNALTQELHQVLPVTMPPIPEAVDTRGNRALRLSRALSLVTSDPPTDATPYLRPRQPVNYRTFYNSNRRRRGKEER